MEPPSPVERTCLQPRSPPPSPSPISVTVRGEGPPRSASETSQKRDVLAAALRFDAIASSDTDDDGEVTLAELSAKKLVDIDPTGGPYGTGSAGNVNDLGTFVTALSQTLGHFRGEGECFSTNP